MNNRAAWMTSLMSPKGYGIDGTDAPSSIGYAKSHGCIRLRNADVERVFEQVRAGDSAQLHAERTSDIAQFFANVHRAHPTRPERSRRSQGREQ